MKKNILFVDDEPHVRDGLRRMLHGQRGVWEMSFAEGGAQALEILAATPHDVIVTDMRMPHMNGAELLARVHELHPRVVRIVLSGHSEQEAVMRSVMVAHQFLNKPCDAAFLKAVVERACQLGDMLGSEQVLKAVGDLKALPSLPSVYQRLTAAMADPEVDFDDVTAIVQEDPAICAKVLQVVNSSFFGLAKSVSSIRQGVSFLGLATLKNLTLSAAVFRQFEGCNSVPGFSIEEEQAHAALSARIAQRLAPAKNLMEDAFLSALLKDVGLLVLAAEMPDTLTRALDLAKASGRPLHECEREILGTSHAEIGGYLLGIWGMPYPIVEAVAFHHRPGRVGASTFDVLGVIHVADVLAHQAVSGKGREGVPPPELDLDYIAAVGQSEALAAWRDLAAHEAQKLVS